MGSRAEELVAGFRPVSLDWLDEHAALQRRVDNKYLIPVDRLASVADTLRDDHGVLEIDGERVFDYESTYFDTQRLDCFLDHVHDRTPRYKARTRCYVTTGSCFFEVKVKLADDETVKRHIEYDPDARQKITHAARELLDETLRSNEIETTDRELRPSLVTRFQRVTVAAEAVPERVTIDFAVELDAPGEGTAKLSDSHAVIETKTPNGEGPCDELLRRDGLEPVSLSKYRVGIGLLVAPDEDPDYARDVKAMFSLSAARV